MQSASNRFSRTSAADTTMHRTCGQWAANCTRATGVLLDFYFGTAGRTTRGAWGKRYTFEAAPDGQGGESEKRATLCVSDLPAGGTNRCAFAPLSQEDKAGQHQE
jgi:hypothetical protein